MTLIVGVICPEGIVIGSDSQTTIGTELKRINRQNPKVIELKNKCIVFAGAGYNSVLQEVENRVNIIVQNTSNNKGLEGIRDHIDKVIFNVMRKHVSKHKSLYGDFETMPTGNFIFGSWKNSVPLLCHFENDGSSEEVHDYIAIGSGTPYAEVLLKDAYRYRMSLEDSKYLVYSVIRDTEDVDNFVGGEIHIKIIKINGEVQTITEGEISALKTSYATRKDIKKRLDQNWSKIEPAIMKILNEEEIKSVSKDSSLLDMEEKETKINEESVTPHSLERIKKGEKEKIS